MSVATRNGRRQPAIAVHRCQLEPSDRAVRAGIPVTSPARTLVDLAGEVDDRELVRGLREMQFRRLFDLVETQEVLARRPCRALSALVEDLVFAESHLEDRLLAICDRFGIKRPLTQVVVLGHRMDFVWPDERLVVEPDGWESHGTRTAFQADRAISNALQLHGYRILRFTSADLDRPANVAAQIRDALAAAAVG